MTMRHCTIGLEADAGRVSITDPGSLNVCVYTYRTLSMDLRIIYRTLHTTLAPETALSNSAVN